MCALARVWTHSLHEGREMLWLAISEEVDAQEVGGQQQQVSDD